MIIIMFVHIFFINCLLYEWIIYCDDDDDEDGGGDGGDGGDEEDGKDGGDGGDEEDGGDDDQLDCPEMLCRWIIYITTITTIFFITTITRGFEL